jgi:hypothetical protein
MSARPDQRPATGAAISRHVPVEEKLKLWVRSGGRCAICNRYLLEDEFTAHAVNLAELAHNVGHKPTAGSPRGEDGLAVALRNLADNLLLLCGDHHRVVDSRLTRGEYSVEALREIKQRHEDRIEYLTGLGEDAETVVPRVVGAIRGGNVELSEETVRAAIRSHTTRYPRYGLGYGGAGIELDLRRLPPEGTEGYWAAAASQIRWVLDGPVRDGVRRGEIRHLSVFAIARMSLLALVGYHLDDKIPLELYQKQRDGDEGWRWDDSATPVDFELRRARRGDDLARAALVVSLSGTIAAEDLPDTVADDCPMWEIRPVGVPGNPDILRSFVSLENFASSYRDFLSRLEQEQPDASVVDVFPAVPVSAAITLGRAVMRDVHPALRLHERDSSGRFAPALELNR